LLIFSLAFKKQLRVVAIIWIFLHDFGLDVLVHYLTCCNVVEVCDEPLF
jgi:aromatic ring-cleaving dioxygenase